MQRVLAGVLFFCFKSFGQQKIYNSEPVVSLTENNILYKCYDNPITISTGDKKGLTVQVKNGILRKTKVPGEYTLRPDSTKWTTELILKQGNFERTFEFRNRFFPENITYGIIGGCDNCAFYSLAGVYVYIKDFGHNIPFRVDSFLVVRPIGDTVEKHMNQGAHWDATAEVWLKTAKKGTTAIEISRVHVSCGGWSTILNEKLSIYKPEDFRPSVRD
jgi:hypothetical protein